MPDMQIELDPYADFETASRAVLAFLHQRLGFKLWMMTRVSGDDWVVLQAEDYAYEVVEGSTFRWLDTFCSRMVAGRGPRAVPSVDEVRAYSSAPIAGQMPIKAYIGVPVTAADGTLFGTLCAIDPEPQSESIAQELPLIELLARLLGSLVEAEMRAVEQSRLLEHSEQRAMTDALTGVLSRNGWERSMVTEESRALRYGTPVCVLIIDLDDLKKTNDSRGHRHGDTLLQRAAGAIRSAARESDVIARIGGDEFAVLGLGCDRHGGEALAQKISAALAEEGISASLGYAMREPGAGLEAAMIAADSAMYEAKAQRRHARMSDAG